MQVVESVLRSALVAALSVTLFGTGKPSTAQQGKALHSFHDTNNNDGTTSRGGVIFDSAGNLYGTTFYGGAYGLGTVYELSPAASGTWTEKILYSFGGDSTDGAFPDAGVIMDKSGNLYGTTNQGGVYGFGTVFELIPPKSGGWAEKVLHSFNASANDGASPQASLVFDSAGNLYGTTDAGGAYSFGTVFQLKPLAAGNWSERVIHAFRHNNIDGTNPQAGLIFDRAGNLYGTTNSGGTYDGGTVFELKPQKAGWSEQVLHSFSGVEAGDGAAPGAAGVIFDSLGNLYGTTYSGGRTFNDGTIYELSPSSGGSWTETILFVFDGTNGEVPNATLVFDSAGNLYGTTGFGGLRGLGGVFELTDNNGVWTETQLYGFTADGGAGATPSSLVLDSSGNLYGTLASGGAYNSGVVFEVTP